MSKFDPLRFGFRPITDFPMVVADMEGYLNPRRLGHTFIKVDALGGDEFEPHETRLVFWYTICDTLDLGDRDRITLLGHSYCSAEFQEEGPRGAKEYLWPTRLYFGPIGSDAFAELLLENLIGEEWREDENEATLVKWRLIQPDSHKSTSSQLL